MLPDSTSRVSSPIGTCFHAPTTDLWGPDETRVSRPVLREREGEIPSRHLPKLGGELEDSRQLLGESTRWVAKRASIS
jgi:hypothetical protein